jgi:UMF1 family MFS transporter
MKPKTLFGWKLYDFANSAYVLTTATALLPAWFASVVSGPSGTEAFGLHFSASTLWGLAVSAAAAVIFALAPILGAVADIRRNKKKFWTALCASGCLFAILLALPGRGDVWQCLGLFVAAQICFAGANVFYDAFLPEIAPADQWDALSGQGFAWGYVGGGLHFALCLLLIAFHQAVGLDKAQAVRLAMISAAVWWGLFSIPGFLWIDESKVAASGSDGAAAARQVLRRGLLQSVRTLKILLRGSPASRFLLAYLLFNDGVQTVIAMAAIYGKEELALPETALMTTLLLVQAVAMVGALLFGRLAGKIGAKRALSASLALWCVITFWAAFIHTANQYMALGCAVGLVLGGVQALSRSFFASLVPPEETAQYFGYFSVVAKLSAILGPLVFAAASFAFGSARPAAPVMAVFFLSGLWLLNNVRSEADTPTA